MGGGGLGEGQDGGPSHPKSDADEGAPVLMMGLWEEGTL